MDSTHTRIAKATSIGLRLTSYLFLRWALVPILPSIAFTLFAVYVGSFAYCFLNGPDYGIIEDEVDVVLTESVKEKDAGEDGAPDEAEDEPEVVVEQIDIAETIVVGEKPVNPFEILLLGAPNPRSLALSAITLFINLGTVALVADRIFSERKFTGEDLSFVRVGYVSDTEAKLLIREPDQAKMPVTVEIHIKDPQAPFDNPLWQTAGGVRWTTNETDYTAVITVPLRHSKQRTYEWKSSNNHSGEFTAGPKMGHAPDYNGGSFTFLSTSCIVARLPYSPFDHPLAIPGMRHLAAVLPTLSAQFMLFLGDFIYVEVPRWWGTEVEDYRRKYRQVYASPDWQAVGQNLSWIHVLDDHEISNDWSANTTGVYQNAVDPWRHYHTAANPPLAQKAGALTAASREGATYFEFSQGPASFFMLDTRTYRSSNLLPYTDSNKTMLGAGQLEDLFSFLHRPEPAGVRWKIIASSVPFTKNWQVNTRDTWGGFLAERHAILEAMWEAGTRGYGVVILSGDRHEFAATKFPPPENGTWPQSAAVYEFSASPLSQFYSPIPSYRQTDNEDVKIKYINKGNSKFGAITIETHEGGAESTLKYRLFVDGVDTWSTVILSPTPAVEEKTGGSFWSRIRGHA